MAGKVQLRATVEADLPTLFEQQRDPDVASRRVLQKCGFVPDAEARGFASARGNEIDEVVMKLDSPGGNP
jgi:hypothetical protein